MTSQRSGDPPPIHLSQPNVPRGDSIAVIAEEELVGPLAGEHHLDMLPCQAGDKVQRYAGGERDGFVFMPDEMGQGFEKLLGRHNDFAVFRPDRASGKPGIGEFIRFRLGKAHREGADRLLDHGSHQGRQAARIQTAGEEQAKRNVTHEMAAHRGRQPSANLAGPLL